jgi:DNA ligase-4
VIKNLTSQYVPNERKNKWVKLKPEYIEGLGDDLDLLIIGGYYGTGVGRRGGTISHFLLGVAAPSENEDNKDPKVYDFSFIFV